MQFEKLLWQLLLESVLSFAFIHSNGRYLQTINPVYALFLSILMLQYKWWIDIQKAKETCDLRVSETFYAVYIKV